MTQTIDIPILNKLYQKVIKEGELEKIPIQLSANVLDAYREKGGYKIIRTDTMGRISKPGGFKIDFGIYDNDTTIQVLAGDLVHKLPDKEKDHWLTFILTPSVSENFVKGAIRPGCLDDGDIRKW